MPEAFLGGLFNFCISIFLHLLNFFPNLDTCRARRSSLGGCGMGAMILGDQGLELALALLLCLSSPTLSIAFP